MTRAITAVTLLVVLVLLARPAAADVVVLANRTPRAVKVTIRPQAANTRQVAIPAWNSVPLFQDGSLVVEFRSSGRTERFSLDANSAYYFGETQRGVLSIHKIGLGGDAASRGGRRLPRRDTALTTSVVPVKILVDEEEPAVRQRWEDRLRKRLAAATKIIEKHSRVKFKIVAIDTWASDNRITDFTRSLREFENEVKPFPARLAIGFSSQYNVRRGATRLGGTRGPLRSHILVREWAGGVSEHERLEVLVHELGHFLGASHSPELDSVMRPLLSERGGLTKRLAIRFDPVNTLLISMIGEEIKRRRVSTLTELLPATKRRLGQIYSTMGAALPDDPAAQMFLVLLQNSSESPLVTRTRQVLAELVSAARRNGRFANPTSGGVLPAPREGDALTNYYVRSAARFAAKLPEDTGPAAFLLALGIALDDSSVLEQHPSTRRFLRVVETPADRTVRRKVIGEPTMRRRRDWARHFFVSAYLAGVLGGEATLKHGLAKELLDAQGGSGFSFADQLANESGIVFAGAVLRKRIKLADLAKDFRVDSFFPSPDGLAEGLSGSEFAAKYGDVEDPRFTHQRRRILARIAELPTYVRLASRAAEDP